jgi:transposase, IS30 family
VERRRQAGHWETDTPVGSTGVAALVTSVERKSRFVRLKRVASRQARPVTHALLATLSPLAGLVRSLTIDRGSEFAEYALIERALDIKACFADPYCAWQSG